MRANQFLSEARRNSALNPEISTVEQLENLYQQTLDSGNLVGQTPNLFVSFTRLDKLGINPKSEYATPVGIYCYPVGQLLEHHKQPEKSLFDWFATDSPYANIFSVQDQGIYSLDDMSATWVNEIFRKRLLVLLGSGSEVEALLENIYNRSSIESRVKTPGGRFWYVTWRVAGWLADQASGGRGTERARARRWTALFRRLGIRGIIDSGQGIIHRNEPFQAVFFEIGLVERNTRIYNREHKSTRASRHQQELDRLDQVRRRLDQAYLTLSDADYRNFVIRTVRYDPPAIRLIRDPKLRWHVLKLNPQAFNWVNRIRPEEWEHAIKNPMLLITIQRSGRHGQLRKIPASILQKVIGGRHFSYGGYLQLVEFFSRPDSTFPLGFFNWVVRLRPDLFFSPATPAEMLSSKPLLLQGYNAAVKRNDTEAADKFAMQLARINYQ